MKKSTSPFISIDKSFTEEVIANNNKRVNYTITITRSASSPAGAMTVHLTDTASGSGVLTGNSGGVLTYVPNTATCSNSCGDIM